MGRFVSQAVAQADSDSYRNRKIYDTPGNYTFTVPNGVAEMMGVVVGGGGEANYDPVLVQEEFFFCPGAGGVDCTSSTQPHLNFTCWCCIQDCMICNCSCCSLCYWQNTSGRNMAYAEEGVHYANKRMVAGWTAPSAGYAEGKFAPAEGESIAITVAGPEGTSSIGSYMSATGGRALCCVAADCTEFVEPTCMTCYCCCVCYDNQCCGYGYWCFKASHCVCAFDGGYGRRYRYCTAVPGCGVGGDINRVGAPSELLPVDIWGSTHLCNHCCYTGSSNCCSYEGILCIANCSIDKWCTCDTCACYTIPAHTECCQIAFKGSDMMQCAHCCLVKEGNFPANYQNKLPAAISQSHTSGPSAGNHYGDGVQGSITPTYDCCITCDWYVCCCISCNCCVTCCVECWEYCGRRSKGIWCDKKQVLCDTVDCYYECDFKFGRHYCFGNCCDYDLSCCCCSCYCCCYCCINGGWYDYCGIPCYAGVCVAMCAKHLDYCGTCPTEYGGSGVCSAGLGACCIIDGDANFSQQAAGGGFTVPSGLMCCSTMDVGVAIAPIVVYPQPALGKRVAESLPAIRDLPAIRVKGTDLDGSPFTIVNAQKDPNDWWTPAEMDGQGGFDGFSINGVELIKPIPAGPGGGGSPTQAAGYLGGGATCKPGCAGGGSGSRSATGGSNGLVILYW